MYVTKRPKTNQLNGFCLCMLLLEFYSHMKYSFDKVL